MTDTRTYLVADKDNGAKRLIKAGNKVGAQNYAAKVTRDRFEAHVATQDELIALLKEGVEVEIAGEG